MTVFDRDPMSTLARGQNNVLSYYYAKEDELRDPSNYASEIYQMMDRTGMPLGIEKRSPVYSDQILPFDITITAQNEYGQMATQRIYGVEILNSGAGLSVDDIVNEMQMTFVARSISPWSPITVAENGGVEFWDRVDNTLRTQTGTQASAGMQSLG